jgi:hypothetical protein
MSSDWELLTADITPPNIADAVAIATEDDWLPFEFERVWDYGNLGIVLEVPEEVTAEMDGAPIVNEFGRLVGITRVRWDEAEGQQVAYGLPVRWLFDLFRGTLSSKLTDLQRLKQWDDWRSKNWDEANAMTHGEFERGQRVAELERELSEERLRKKADSPTSKVARRAPWWRRWPF